MIGQVIQEYLVALGARVDKPGFQEADRTIQSLDRTVATVTGNMASNFRTAGTIIATSMAGVTASIYGVMRSAANTDLEMTKLARTMMMGKDQVYAMKKASDALGESINDIMLTPELLERFKQLNQEGRQMKVGGDFEATMRGFRDLMFEFTRLKQEVSYAMTWVGYYLMKYLNKPLTEAREKFKAFNDSFIRNMSVWTQKAAKALVYIINIGRHMVEFLWNAGKGVAGLFMAFPRGVRVAIGALALLFAVIKASPLGRMIALVSTLMILIDDYYGYMEGKQAAFGKYWNKLNAVIEKAKDIWEEFEPVAESLWNTIAEYAEKAKEGILGLAEGAGDLVERIGNSEELRTFLSVVKEIAEGIGNLAWATGKFLVDSITGMYEALQETGVIDAFREAIGKVLKVVLYLGHILGQVLDSLGKLINEMGRTEEIRELRMAFAELFGAVSELFGAIMDLVYEALSGLFGEMNKTKTVYSFRDAIRALAKVVSTLIKGLTWVIRLFKNLFKLLKENGVVKAIFEAIGRTIDLCIEKMGRLAKAIGVLFNKGTGGITEALGILTGEGGKEAGRGDTDWNKRVVYERFKEAGYSDEAIAGIMGRVQQEHNFNTSDVPEHWTTDADGNPIYVGGYGMFQLNGGRTDAFKAWAKQNGLNPQDPGTQADYAIIEARQRGITPERMNSKSVSEAATIWTDEWEVGKHGDEQAYAAEIYGDIKNGAPWLNAKSTTSPKEATPDNVHEAATHDSEGNQIGYAGGASIARANSELRQRFSDAIGAMRDRGYDFYIQNATEGSIGFTSTAEDWENIRDVLESYGLSVSHDSHGFYVSLPETARGGGSGYAISTSATSGLMAGIRNLYNSMSSFMPTQGGYSPYMMAGNSTGNVVINNQVNVGGVTVQGGANATAEEIGRQVGEQVNTRLAQRAQYFENSIQQNGSPILGVGSKMSPVWT